MLLALSLIGLSTTAGAHPAGSAAQTREPLEHLVETLGLDEATLGKVYAIIDTSRAVQRESRRKMREAHQQMRTLLEQETPDEVAIMTQADVIGALKTEMVKQRLQTILKIRALLTSEQRAKLLETLRAHHWHGGHGFPPRNEEP